MSVRVQRIAEDDRDEWNEYVADSRQAGPLHRYGGLTALASGTDTALYPLVGYKGQEPIGLFPVFEGSKATISAAFSPPPDVLVPYLGPVMLDAPNLKQRTAEKRHRRFLEACLEWIETEISPRYTHVRTGPEYTDLRMFQWEEFDVSPEYTYVVDLDRDEEDLRMSFSRDARSNIDENEDEDLDCTVEEGGLDAIDWTIDQVASRYEYQDKSYPLTREFVHSLYDSLPSGRLRPYECTVDGERIGGMITLEDGDTIHRWQGGAKPETDLPVNDILDWHIMRDARERDIGRYDLVGASTPRLNRYKAKFGPRLAAYHGVERGAPGMRFAAKLYKRLR